MKKAILLLSLMVALVSCKKEEEKKEPLYPEIKKSTEEVSEEVSEEVPEKAPMELGQEIFSGRGKCYTCHKPNEKLVGPSLVDIGKKYREKGASITDFLTEKSGPIVDPSQYNVMKTNFPLTKNLSEEELNALQTYVLSFSE